MFRKSKCYQEQLEEKVTPDPKNRVNKGGNHSQGSLNMNYGILRMLLWTMCPKKEILYPHSGRGLLNSLGGT